MAVENGPCCMYKLKPFCSFLEQMELPTNMYRLPNIHQFAVKGNDESKEFIAFEKHQIEVLEKLRSLNSKLIEMRKEFNIDCATSLVEATPILHESTSQVNKHQDIVINANPNHPPFSVWVLCHLLQKQTSVMLNVHVHSTVTDFPTYLNQLKEEEANHSRMSYDVLVTVIWKNVGKDPELMVNPFLQTAITSEVNIARYLARLLKPPYDEGAPEISTEVDTWLDIAHCSMLHGSTKERQSTLWNMNLHLATHAFLVGSKMTIADIVMWSALYQTKLTATLPENVEKWWKNLHATGAFLCLKGFL